METMDCCDVCGAGHMTEACPELGLSNTPEELRQLTKARLTLPYSLELRLGMSGNLGVHAKETLPAKMRFGPFEARKTLEHVAIENVFILKIFGKEGNAISLNASSENDCNWMCLLHAAEVEEQQNCMAYQIGADIFYSMTKDVAQGEELRVWYTPFYAKKLDMPSKPDGITKTMLEKANDLIWVTQVVTMDHALFLVGGTGDASARQQVENRQSNDRKSHTTNAYHTIAVGSQQNDDFRQCSYGDDVETGAELEGDSTINCTRCDQTFSSMIEMAKHLRDHFRPKGIVRCQGCNLKFSDEQCYNDHDCKPPTPPVPKKRGRKPKRAKLTSDEDTEDFKVKTETAESDVGSSTNLRSQPRRSLKGLRITGNKAVDMTSDEEIAMTTPPATPTKPVTKTPKVQTPKPSGRKRGRPRKVVVSDEDCSKEMDSTLKKISQDDISSDTDKLAEEMEQNEEEVETTVKAGKENIAKEAVSCSKSSSRRKEKMKKGDGEKTGAAATINEDDDKIDPTSSDIMSLMSNVSKVDDTDSFVKEDSNDDKVDDKDSLVKEDSNDDKVVKPNDNGDDGIQNKNDDDGIQNENDGDGIQNENGADGIQNENVGDGIQNENGGDGIQNQNGDDGIQNENGDAEIQNDNVDAGIQNDDDDREGKDDGDFKPDEEENDNDENSKTAGKIEQTFNIVYDIKTRVKSYQCKVCLKMFSSSRLFRLHEPKHTDKYCCETCKKRFARKDSFDKHRCEFVDEYEIVEKTVNGVQMFCCGECGKGFANEKYARRHLTVHKGSWKCGKCFRLFPRRNLLSAHVCKEEPNEGEFKCDICLVVFTNEKYLYRHMAMHTDMFKCQRCEKCFSRKDSLYRHILTCDPEHASNADFFFCAVCERTFATKSGMDNHAMTCAIFTCTKCQRKCGSAEALEAHDCENEEEMGINDCVCKICDKAFSSMRSLQRHDITHQGLFACKECGKSYSRNEELVYHEAFCSGQATIRETGSVECLKCNEAFEDAKAYQEHCQAHTHPHKCQKCGKSFVKISTLNGHKCTRIMPGENGNCPLCEKTFSDTRNLERHLVTHGEPQFQCEFCPKKFYRSDYLWDHSCVLPDGTKARVIRKHNKMFVKEKVVCDQCGQSFINNSNLNKHKIKHGERTFKCEYCNKLFHYGHYLKEHIASVHESSRQHQCSDCGKVFKTRNTWKMHQRNFHRGDMPTHECPVCQKCFKMRGNLKTHMYSHSKGKTFQCRFCSKMFRYPEQYRSHELTHTLEDKFDCEICHKKFVKRYMLKAHLSVFHSGLIYKCQYCDVMCAHKHTLRRHYRKKHRAYASLMNEPDYIKSLLQSVEEAKHSVSELKSDMDSNVEVDGDRNLPREFTLTGDVYEQESQEMEVSETTEINSEVVLPDAAAQVLRTLSQAVLSGEHLINLSDLQNAAMQTVQGEDGETVIILQVINDDGEEEQVTMGALQGI